MNYATTWLLVCALLSPAYAVHAAGAPDSPPVAAPEEKVVYHINDSANAMVALRNVQNHLQASQARIVVVTHGKGIDFLLNGAQDDKGNPYAPLVEELKARAVDFRVCNNTLKSRKLDASAVIPEASIVPSGVAEVGRLQAREGFVYLKP